MDRTPRGPGRAGSSSTPDHIEYLRHNLEILDRIASVRVGLEAILMGRWAPEEDTITELAALLSSAAVHARAMTLVSDRAAA